MNPPFSSVPDPPELFPPSLLCFIPPSVRNQNGLLLRTPPKQCCKQKLSNMVLLENEAFLTELTRLFQKSRSAGSIYITMKRYDGRTKPKPRPSKLATNPLPPVSEYKCLIRAHLGNKKLSTVVNAKDVNKFQLAYANLLKGNMDGLKKKDKKKVGTSTKATQ